MRWFQEFEADPPDADTDLVGANGHCMLNAPPNGLYAAVRILDFFSPAPIYFLSYPASYSQCLTIKKRWT